MIAAVIKHSDAFDRHPIRTCIEERDAVRVEIDVESCELVGVLTRQGAEPLRDSEVVGSQEMHCETCRS